MHKYGDLIEKIEFFSLLSQARKVHGPYQNGNQNRKIVIIIEDDGSRRTVSYPKFLYEEHLKRKLDPNMETIDHIDRDHSNNDLNNLRIVPRSQHSKDDTRRVKLVKFNCSMCNKEFERSPRLVRDKSKKGTTGIFCSRQCAGRYARQLQLGQVEKFEVQPYVESEYYRNVKAMADFIIKKYAL